MSALLAARAAVDLAMSQVADARRRRSERVEGVAIPWPAAVRDQYLADSRSLDALIVDLEAAWSRLLELEQPRLAA